VLVGGVTSGRLYDALAVAPRGQISNRRLADLDVIRAIAALLVVVNHMFIMGGPFYPKGYISAGSLILHGTGSGGVSLFFVLSGFLIAGPFLRSRLDGRPQPDPRRYFIRRGTRIMPAYWVALLAAVLLLTPPGGVAWWQIPLHAALFQSYVPGQIQLMLVVAWSLCIELAFYVFVPVAAGVVARIRSARIDLNTLALGILGVWAAGIAVSILVSLVFPDATRGAGQVLRLALPKTIVRFLPGLLVFLALTEQAAARGGPWALYRRLVRRPWLPLGLAFVAWLAGCLAHQSSSILINDLGINFFAIAGALVLAVACAGLSWMKSLVHVIAPLGIISYGIYLWHWIVINVLVHHNAVPLPGWSIPRFVLHLLVAGSITVALALASWLFVERPFMRWRHVSAPREPAPAVPAA
jgi:peptidoglycan/LPS O-acetylase OafA/YrhL